MGDGLDLVREVIQNTRLEGEQHLLGQFFPNISSSIYNFRLAVHQLLILQLARSQKKSIKLLFIYILKVRVAGSKVVQSFKQLE